MSARVVAIVGNPRASSRTHALAETLAGELARVLGAGLAASVDLAGLGPAVLDPGSEPAAAAVETVLRAEVLVVASPTYKATYSGLLKAFLDRLATGALAGAAAVPLLLGGAADHRLAVDVHLTPLLLELGARVPTRGLFVLERDVEGFRERAEAWAEEHGALFAPAVVALPR